MALPRTTVMDGLASSMADFETLLRSLDPGAWDKTSRCDGWTVGDVARHAVGSMADAVGGRTDGLGSPEATQREVDERAGRSPAELADECAEVAKAVTAVFPLFDDEAWAAPAPGGFEGTLGDGVEALWADFWIHADDIRHAVGLDSVADAGLARRRVPRDLRARQARLGRRGARGRRPDPVGPERHRPRAARRRPHQHLRLAAEEGLGGGVGREERLDRQLGQRDVERGAEGGERAEQRELLTVRRLEAHRHEEQRGRVGDDRRLERSRPGSVEHLVVERLELGDPATPPAGAAGGSGGAR